MNAVRDLNTETAQLVLERLAFRLTEHEVVTLDIVVQEYERLLAQTIMTLHVCDAIGKALAWVFLL